MKDVLSITAASMLQDMQRAAVVSNNLANATTPAYRRELTVGVPFGPMLGAGGPSTPAAPGNDVVIADERPGALRATGNPLDVALEEAGYLEVMTPRGPRYTRQGNFQVDTAGRLVNGNGWPVMGVSGEIVLAGTAPRIEADGRIFEQNLLAGQLKVVRFADGRQLAKDGDGLHVATAEAAQEAATPRLRQGHLESSNVVTAHEMVRLIETVRHFEASQKVIHGYDEMLERAIRALGEF